MAVRRRAGTPYYWYDFTINGRRFRGSTGKKTKQEAQAVEAAERINIEANESPSKWKLTHAAGMYWEHRASRCSSAATLEYQIANLLRIIGKDMALHAITNAGISDFIAKRRAEVSDSSVNRELTLLRAIMHYARDAWDQPIPRINWKIHRLKEPPGRDRFLSQEEYTRLISVADPALRPIIIFAVNTGLRLENILSLSWHQVDMTAGVLRVLLKGGRRHVVKLNGDCLALLQSLPRSGGRVFDRTNFRKRWMEAVDRAKIADLRFHDLRHTFASWCRMNGVGIEDIQDALGHTDISMTMRYAHIKPGAEKSAFDRVSAQSTVQWHVKSLKENDK